MKKLWQRLCVGGIFRYILFGMLTTLLNYGVYFALYYAFAWFASASNAVAWLVSVLFAFVVNKKFVFCSQKWTWQIIRKELSSFLIVRIGSGTAETLLLLLMVDVFQLESIFSKVFAAVFVVILNYFSSKMLVFSANE